MDITKLMNPQYAKLLKQVMQEVRENNGDAQGLFYKKAKEMGIDPQSILKQLGGM